MTNSEFYTWVAVLNKTTATWLHEGVVMKLNREKGGQPISDEAVKRFCKDLRSDIAEIENLLTQQFGEKT